MVGTVHCRRRAAESAGRELVKRRKPTYQTKASRKRVDFWTRFGVWIFIVFFALSVAGGLIVVSTELTRR